MKTRLKKYIFFALLLIQLCVLCLGVGTTVSALANDDKNTAEAKEELNENILGMLNELDLAALQEYVDGLENIEMGSVKDALFSFIGGSAPDYSTFGKQILEALFGNLRELLPPFACIAAIALLSGILSTLRSGTIANTSADMIFLVSYAAALIPLLGVVTECVRVSINCVSAMQKQMQILFPLVLTLMATSGSTLTVAVCKPAVSFFSTTIVSIFSSVVFPLTVAIIAFSLASNFTKDLKINKFGAFFKSINKWIIGVCISVFGLFFTLQGFTAASYDGVVRRAAKYAIGNGIPIVGGFLSGGFDLAVAGSILIKNSLGSLSIFLMVSVLFEPIVLLLSVNLLLRFTAAVTQPFGDSRISDFLGETAENLNYCTAGVLFTAFLYFLTVVILVTVSEALF